MKNIFKLGMLSIAFMFVFASVGTANAQDMRGNKQARKEYRKDVREARKEYRQDTRDERKEMRQDRREARKEYRSSTGRRYNNGYYTSNNRRRLSRGYYTSRSRRAYPQRSRVYYRNGRRYVLNY